MSVLDWISLFSSLTQNEKDNLALFCQERFIKNWETLFKEHDEATALYIVKSWKLKAYKDRSDGEITLGIVMPWEFVWEMAFFDWENVPKRRMASVKTLEDSTLVVIMNYSIMDLSNKRKDIYEKIVRIIEERKQMNLDK